MEDWEKNAKYKDNFDEAQNKTSQMITIARGIKKRIYDLRYALAFGKITFDEYERKLKELKKNGGNN